MQALQFKININASKEKVWNTMLQKPTYEIWTKPFNETSTFEGNWAENSEMIFLGSDPETAEEGGMISIIKQNIPSEFMSIQHIGEFKNGEREIWENAEIAFENYTLTEVNSETEVQVDLTSVPDEYVEWMNDLWPKALESLKNLAESN